MSEEKTVVKHEPRTDSSDDLRISRKKFYGSRVGLICLNFILN